MSVKKRINALDCFGSAEGCFYKGGRLIPAYKAVKMTGNCPDGADFAGYSKALKKVFVSNGGEVYSSDDGWLFSKLGVCYPSPFMIETWNNGVPTAAIISGNHVSTLSGSLFIFQSFAMNLRCGVMHCGRLFGADYSNGFILRWSGPEGYDDWEKESYDENGYMWLDPERGEILNLIVYNGKLVAVREYGLTVLSMYGSPENFSVDITDTDCDKIYKNTACVVGDKLCFYSASGLKCFDGSKISSVSLRHKATSPVCCCGYGDRYFLADKSVILCVDLSDGESCEIKASANALYVKDGVYFCDKYGLSRLESGADFNFKSGVLDFGTGRLKTVTEIDVRGTADISISNGVSTRIFTGVSGVVRPRLRGRSFTVTVKGNGEIEAVNLTAEVTDAV